MPHALQPTLDTTAPVSHEGSSYLHNEENHGECSTGNVPDSSRSYENTNEPTSAQQGRQHRKRRAAGRRLLPNEGSEVYN